MFNTRRIFRYTGVYMYTKYVCVSGYGYPCSASTPWATTGKASAIESYELAPHYLDCYTQIQTYRLEVIGQKCLCVSAIRFCTLNQDVQNIWATARRRRRLAYKTFEAADYELYDSKVQSFQHPSTQCTVLPVPAGNRKYMGRKYCGGRQGCDDRWWSINRAPVHCTAVCWLLVKRS